MPSIYSLNEWNIEFSLQLRAGTYEAFLQANFYFPRTWTIYYIKTYVSSFSWKIVSSQLQRFLQSLFDRFSCFASFFCKRPNIYERWYTQR